MTRHVHGVYAPAGDAAYATPDGEIIQVPQDFAFADTVVALDEEIPTAPLSQRPPGSIPPSIPAPPSRPPMSRPPGSYRDHTRPHELAELHAQQQMQMQQMQQMQMQAGSAAYSHVPRSQPPMSRGPTSYPPPASYPPPSFEPGIAGALQRAKHTINSSRGEMQELWSATGASEEKDPLVRLARRVKTFWGFFEWDKDDVARAAWIGLAVFVIVVCAAFVLR